MTGNPKHNVKNVQFFLETPIDFFAQRSAHLIIVVLTYVRVPLEESTWNQINNIAYFRLITYYTE